MRFLFYDQILEMELGKRALARKVVALSEEYFTEHYSRTAIMPGTLLVETLAQVAGWLNVVTNDFAIDTVLGLIEGVRIHRQVYPGDVLNIEVWMAFSHADGATLRGEIRLGDEQVVTVNRMVFANGRVTDPVAIQRERDRFKYLSGGYTIRK